jgi:hypothetical protein
MVICDECEKEFEVKASTKKLTNGISETSFKCPHCKKKYISYFTNRDIRIKQKNINKLWEKYRKASDDEEVAEMVIKIRTMKASIKILMDNLKIKMLGAQ